MNTNSIHQRSSWKLLLFLCAVQLVGIQVVQASMPPDTIIAHHITEIEQLLKSASFPSIILLDHDTIRENFNFASIYPTDGKLKSSLHISNSVFLGPVICKGLDSLTTLQFTNCHFLSHCMVTGLLASRSRVILRSCIVDSLLVFGLPNRDMSAKILVDSCKIGDCLHIANSTAPPIMVQNSSIISIFCALGDSSRCDIRNCRFPAGSYLDDYNNDLSNITLTFCQFDSTIFEATRFPNGILLGTCEGFASLTFWDSPAALVAIRNWFKANGYREREREITYALRRTENELQIQPLKFFEWLLFDLTCSWGMNYGRPLAIGIALVFLFWPVYWWLCFRTMHSDLYRHWKPLGKDQDKFVSLRRIRQFGSKSRFLPARAALLFSVMSAFNIGFREFNFSRWIRNLTKHDYDLRTKGWARTISGIQALITVFLFALFLLAYLGHPFE